MKAMKKMIQKRAFDKFVGILDKNFETDDKRYNKIIEKKLNKDKNG